MLIACLDTLREFWHATEQERLTFGSRVIEDPAHRLRVRIYVEMHPDFQYSSGETIERPWLRLQALPPDNDHIGLGMIKCRAICEVKDELRQWLQAQRALE